MEINCSHKTLPNTALLTAEPRYSQHTSVPEQAWIQSGDSEKGGFRNELKVRGFQKLTMIKAEGTHKCSIVASVNRREEERLLTGD